MESSNSRCLAVSIFFGMGLNDYYFNNDNGNGNHHPNMPQFSSTNTIEKELQQMLPIQQKEQQKMEKQKAIAELIRLRELKLQRQKLFE
ncbi:hypothetical protein DICPUDRAFT_158572 [Dictyostelium purpureum]|uniref:Uncharacterized protein n=1 Tax=Dictyostelium purpureum TaxID=5786 RepID=F1A1X6_DICPU|nr:uncharacterized protein DICPUDRAFT_158572 [Dictyostelium purpureum]EGC29802.1 hypothetical protein DICPUDRAFT_158572 [Dictyostelium purpureum]|eukprot:XP_003293667.1 hypothetical protein DICPUDRAFT_158572 [Dictyostelium purpureum]